MIKDRIVCGIDDKSVRERLLRDNDLTLDKAINIVRAAETSKTQVEKLSNPSIEVESLNQNSDRKSRRKHQEEIVDQLWIPVVDQVTDQNNVQH